MEYENTVIRVQALFLMTFRRAIMVDLTNVEDYINSLIYQKTQKKTSLNGQIQKTTF